MTSELVKFPSHNTVIFPESNLLSIPFPRHHRDRDVTCHPQLEQWTWTRSSEPCHHSRFHSTRTIPTKRHPSYDTFKQCFLMEADAGNNEDAHRQMLARCLGFWKDGWSRSDVHRSFYQTLWVFQSPTCQLEPHSFSVRQNKGSTPAPSEYPSRPSFEMHSPFFSEAVEPAPRDHQNAKRLVSMLSNSMTPKLSYCFEGFKAW